MENIIAWIAIVLVGQGINFFITKRKKQRQKKDSLRSVEAIPHASPHESSQAAQPLGSFFSRLEEAAKNDLAQDTQQEWTEQGQENRSENIEPDHMLRERERDLRFEQEWNTSLAENRSVSQAGKDNQDLFEKHKKTPLQAVALKSPIKQAFIWKEIIDKPLGLR